MTTKKGARVWGILYGTALQRRNTTNTKGDGGPPKAKRRKGYKNVRGSLRFYVKEIKDGWLVRRVMGVASSEDTGNGDTACYFVERGEGPRAIKLKDGEFEEIDRRGSYAEGIKCHLEDVLKGKQGDPWKAWVQTSLMSSLRQIAEDSERRLVLKAVAKADPEYAKELVFWGL